MYTDYEDDNKELYYDDDNNKYDKEKLKRIAFIVLVSVIVLILILIIAKGCSKRKNTTTAINNNQPVVALARDNISLDVGESFTLNYNVLSTSKTNPTVIWKSEDSSIASVNEQGYITGESEGETKIVAIYKENNKLYYGNCDVIVTKQIIEPKSIDLGQENITMKKGGSFLLQVTITPPDAKVDKLEFSSDDSNIASVDEKGYIKANAIGTTTITVKTSDGKLSDKVNVNVIESKTNNNQQTVIINPTSIKLMGLDRGLSVGGTSKFIYQVLPNNATNKNVTWTSSNPSIATVSNGVVRGIKSGSCTIMATTSNNISSSINVTVESNSVSVSSITISGSTSISMNVGYTKRIYYTISPSNATNKNVTWTSSNSKVATVDSNGIIGAVGVGNAIIKVTTSDGKKTAIVNVTVKDSSSNNTTTPSSNNTSSSSSSSGNNSDNTTSTYSSEISSSYSTCNADSVIVKSNQDSAVTSNLRFENAKAFTNSNAGLYVTTYDSCLKSVTYNLWYNADKNKLNTSSSPTITGTFPKQHGTLYLDKGNGYYIIKVNITTNNENNYTKYYYAIVNNKNNKTNGSSTKNNVSLSWTKTCNGTKGTFNVVSLNSISNITKFSYCFTNRSSGCSTSEYKTLYNNSTGTKSYAKQVVNTNNNNLLCLSASSKNGNSYQTCFPNVKCS